MNDDSHDNIDLYSEGDYMASTLYDPASGGFRVVVWNWQTRKAVHVGDILHYDVREAEAFARKRIKALLRNDDTADAL